MADFYAGLIDHRGMPIKKAELLQEQGSASLRNIRQSTHQATGLTPQRLAAILRESIDGDPLRYLELAEDMEERHEHYQSVLAIRKLQVSGLDISVEAASDGALDLQIADLVRDVLSRPEFQDEIVDILDALGKSFSCTEIIWDTSERQWMPKLLKYETPTLFTFDRDNRDVILLRGDSGDEVLKPYSWIVHIAKAKSGLTIRGGLARMAAWSFFFKSFTSKDWAIFCEAYGQPLRLGKYGPGASETDKDTLLRAVSSIGADYAAIIPESMQIDFVKADLSGSHDLYEKRCEYLDRQVSKLILGQVGTTDAVAGGFSGNKVHNEVREDIERDDARRLAITISRDLVRPLVDLNYGRQKKYPTVKIGRPDEEDVEKVVKNVATLLPFGLKVGMSTMRDKIGVPDPDKDEELLTLPQTNTTPIAPAKKPEANEPPVAARAELPAHPTDAIEMATDDLLGNGGWEPLVAPIVDGLEEELAEAQSEQDVFDILERRSQTLGVTALTELLAKMVFASRLAGETEQDLS